MTQLITLGKKLGVAGKAVSGNLFFPQALSLLLFIAMGCLGECLLVRGDDIPIADNAATSTDVQAGHSYHGEAFNEGPRQAAKKMEGLAKITFATSAKSPETQAFIEQGIAQLHGFWYLEAERSFRQAAANEPELAIAYWGCAMANINNRKRANDFIDEAMKRREKETSDREKKYIESFERFLKATADKPTVADESKPDDKKPKPSKKEAEASKKEAEERKREEKRNANERYISDLENIIDEFPDDLEAKAFLVLQLWLAEGDGVKMPSRYAVDALMTEIFSIDPMHPAHHYRIHLWDGRRPKNALESAAKAGPSMPGVAHMWHMPGHTYSRLHRYSDAVWQQEASARVDHAHMIESRLLPDQIHNYAHNNEWMVRNLVFLGRAKDAIRHAKNLTSLPRHPKYNSFEKGSFRFGRERLVQTLVTFEMWDTLIEESKGPWLARIEDDNADDDRDAWIAVAHFMKGERTEGAKQLRSLQRKLLDLQQQRLDAIDLAESEKAANEKDTGENKDDTTTEDKAPDDQEVATEKTDLKKLDSRIKSMRRFVARVSAAAAAVRGDASALEKHVKDAELDRVYQAQWLAKTKNLEAAEKLAEQLVKDGPGEVPPLAILADIQWRRDKKQDALKRFEELRKVAHSADTDLPMLTALAPIVKEAGLEGDWRIAQEPANDLGERPSWDKLGPEAWQPYAAEPLFITTPEGTEITGDAWEGKPRIVIFYLGAGCLHCVEQLKKFSPRVEEFRSQGIDVFAVSNETTELLKKGLEMFEEEMPIPLFTDPDQMAFMSYRCWDDFESVPLHGTYLIDSKGFVRWQDIGPEPFIDVDFLLLESKRLLSLP